MNQLRRFSIHCTEIFATIFRYNVRRHLSSNVENLMSLAYCTFRFPDHTPKELTPVADIMPSDYGHPKYCLKVLKVNNAQRRQL